MSRRRRRRPKTNRQKSDLDDLPRPQESTLKKNPPSSVQSPPSSAGSVSPMLNPPSSVQSPSPSTHNPGESPRIKKFGKWGAKHLGRFATGVNTFASSAMAKAKGLHDMSSDEGAAAVRKKFDETKNRAKTGMKGMKGRFSSLFSQKKSGGRRTHKRKRNAHRRTHRKKRKHKKSHKRKHRKKRHKTRRRR